MGKPFDKQSFDAFTPTGSGPRTDDVFPPGKVPDHVARYPGVPPYLTRPDQQAKLRKEGAEYGPL
jgi:hypothetical protein